LTIDSLSCLQRVWIERVFESKGDHSVIAGEVPSQVDPGSVTPHGSRFQPTAGPAHVSWAEARLSGLV
jgi:hypothetical protein